METTTPSTRGQIVIPKVWRDSRHWRAGTACTVEEVPQGLLLKPVSAFTPSTLEDVMGCAEMAAGYSVHGVGVEALFTAVEVDQEPDTRRPFGAVPP